MSTEEQSIFTTEEECIALWDSIKKDTDVQQLPLLDIYMVELTLCLRCPAQVLDELAQTLIIDKKIVLQEYTKVIYQIIQHPNMCYTTLLRVKDLALPIGVDIDEIILKHMIYALRYSPAMREFLMEGL